MSKDLEEQLNEMGPEYRAVVARLRASCSVPRASRPVPYLIAASLLVVFGFGVFFVTSQPRNLATSQPAYGAHEYQMDVPEMIATQNPDGSWKNDFLTRRNAAALKLCSDPAAQIAYKKAARNLRLRGIL